MSQKPSTTYKNFDASSEGLTDTIHSINPHISNSRIRETPWVKYMVAFSDGKPAAYLC